MVRKIAYLIVICLLLSLILPVGIPLGSNSVLAATTSVTDLVATLGDYMVDRPTPFNVKFTTPINLTGGTDSVILTFPQALAPSEDISEINVSMNGYQTSISYTNYVLRLLVPSSINILSGGTVEIGIASGVFRNPKTAGDYTIMVTTSQSTLGAVSPNIHITDYEFSDGVSKPSVNINTNATAVNIAYLIKFKTSVNGRLPEGSKIYLTFPTGTEIPSTVNGSCVKINDITLSGQVIPRDGSKIILTVPAYTTIAAGAAVEIYIAPEAGIQNTNSSSYRTLTVSTSVDTHAVISFPDEVKESSFPSLQKKIGLSVVPGTDGAGLSASYTITVNSGLLTPYTSTITDLVLKFPQGTNLPDTISGSLIKVNGIQAAGTLTNPGKGELIFYLGQSVSSDQSITIVIDKAAGLKNPVAAQYKMDVSVIRSTGALMSDWYAINNTATFNNDNTPTTMSGKRVTLKVDSTVVEVDGVYSILDTAPIINNNFTLVPLRFVADSLGAATEYNAAGNYVKVKLGDKEMILRVNSTKATVNGVDTALNAPAILKNGRLLVPVRFISENFGAQVSWDAGTRKITIVQEGETEQSSGAGNTSNTTPNTAVRRVSVKAENSYVNLRTGPGTGYAIAGKLMQGDTATVIGTDGDWYKVRLNSGTEAWVANWVVNVQTQ